MKRSLLLIGMMLAATVVTKAQSIVLEEFSTGFKDPVGIENAGDNRLFIVEKPGVIRQVKPNGNQTHGPFLNIKDRVWDGGFEQGLLGLAFHPDYDDNGYLYVYYTAWDGVDSSGYSVLSRFSVNKNNKFKAKKNTEKILLTFDQPFQNHNGGALHFGPDGYLYLATGDGGSAGDPFNNAQNLNTYLGKILRIDVDHGNPYAIPDDNPFIDVPGAKKEIWDLGLRNPWRTSFDRLTGNFWIADVGQNMWEEINFEAEGNGGNNYGWRCLEGTHPFAECNPTELPLVPPVYEYMHVDESVAPCGGTVIGGYVYRGDNIPGLYGKYVYTDFCTGQLHALSYDGGSWTDEFLLQGEQLVYTAFGENKHGELFLADLNGNIHRIASAGNNRTAQADQLTKANVTLYPNPNNGTFTVAWHAVENSHCEIMVTNLLGQVLVAEKTHSAKGQNTHAVNAAHLGTGTYLVTIMTPEKMTTTRVMIR